MPFVLDVSVALSWCFGNAGTAGTERLLDRLKHDEAVVPPGWSVDFEDALLSAEKKNYLEREEAEEIIWRMGRLPIQVIDAEWPDRRLLVTARRTNLPAHRAAYADLAHKRSIALASVDDHLRSAAERMGIALLP